MTDLELELMVANETIVNVKPYALTDAQLYVIL